MTIEESRRRWDAHPASSPHTESILGERGISHSFEPNLALDAIRTPEGHQVRLIAHRAPTDLVNTYAVQMRQGAVFPAIVVTNSFEVIDGNSRLGAKHRCGAKSIPAYVCPALSALEIRSLSVELNQAHGQRMTKDEIRNFVISCMRSGVVVEPTTCARITGAKASTIGRWVTIENCRVRAAMHGLSTDGVSDAALVAIATAHLDRVFIELMDAADAGHASAGQLREIAFEANSAASEAEAAAVVDREIGTAVLNADPSTHRGHGSARHVGGLLRFDVDDLLDVAQERQRETYTGLCMIRDLVEAAVSAAEVAWQLDGWSAAQSEKVLKVA